MGSTDLNRVDGTGDGTTCLDCGTDSGGCRAAAQSRLAGAADIAVAVVAQDRLHHGLMKRDNKDEAHAVIPKR